MGRAHPSDSREVQPRHSACGTGIRLPLSCCPPPCRSGTSAFRCTTAVCKARSATKGGEIGPGEPLDADRAGRRRAGSPAAGGAVRQPRSGSGPESQLQHPASRPASGDEIQFEHTIHRLQHTYWLCAVGRRSLVLGIPHPRTSSLQPSLMLARAVLAGFGVYLYAWSGAHLLRSFSTS